VEKTTHLDGKAIALDPGKHALRFEAAGQEPHDEEIVAREGEKNRVVNVRLSLVGGAPSSASAAGASSAPEASSSAVAPPPPPPTPSGPPVIAYVVGALGVVALGVGTYFEIDQSQRYTRLNNSCAPAHTCAQSDVDTVSNERVIGGVALGVGGAALAVAVVLLVTRHPDPDAAQKTGVVWGGVVPSEHGAAAALGGRF
jgi:hypothetical protein